MAIWLQLGLEGDVPAAKREELGEIVDYVSGRNRYVGYLISLAAHSYKNMRVGLDCANGSSWNIAKTVFEALGAKTFVINAEPDGVNINRGAGSTHIDGLRRFVVENHLDVGFAYDGDADRCLAVDENGEVVDGDKIIYIFGCQMKREGRLAGNKVVTTVMSNFGLYKALDEAGVGYEKTAVGDRFVYENMAQNGYCVGGEQSGHIILSKYATTGDGISDLHRADGGDAGQQADALSSGRAGDRISAGAQKRSRQRQGRRARKRACAAGREGCR